MPVFNVKAPDGTIIPVNAPEGATEQQAIEFAASTWKPPVEKPIAWSDVSKEAISNIPSSAAKFAGGIYEAVTSPVKTVGGILDVAAGGLKNITPDVISNLIERVEINPEASQRAETAADTIGAYYKDRYGSSEGFKKALATDPVGVMADLSTVFAGGAGVAARIPGAAKISGVLRSASEMTNPLSAIAPIAKAAGKATGFAARHGLGMTTGVGSENVAQAYKAGLGKEKAFIQNLTGEVPMSSVLDQAKSALENMRATRSAEYKGGIATTRSDATKLNFGPIDKAMNNVIDSMKEGGHWKIGQQEVSKIQELQEIVKEWRKDPVSHTASGLDALKQRLDSLYPDSPMHRQSQRAITSVRNAVKDTIVKQSPEYASTMKNYEDALSIEKEIERALSLNNKASADTALRKLQSLSRQNANTNYGNRLEMAKILKEHGGEDILPAIAGQAMSSWTPRGLAGQAEGIATLGAAALHNPALLGLLPLQSPKAVGATAYGIGRAGGRLSDLLKKSPITDQDTKLLGLLMSQAGKER